MVRRTDTAEGWINRKFQEIDRAIRELRSAKRVITDLTIPGSGGVTTGGIIVMGTQPQGDRGMTFKREDGTQAFRLNKALGPTDPQSWALKDRAGSDVVAENPLGLGLGKPFLEIHFQPYSPTPGAPAPTYGPFGWERVTSSTSWTTLFIADTKAQNYFLDFEFGAFCSDGTTAGEVQIVDLGTGTPLPGFLSSAAWVGSIPAGTTTPTSLDPTPDQVISTVGNGVGSYMRLGVQVRRTAGAGSITLAVAQAIGG